MRTFVEHGLSGLEPVALVLAVVEGFLVGFGVDLFANEHLGHRDDPEPEESLAFLVQLLAQSVADARDGLGEVAAAVVLLDLGPCVRLGYASLP